LTHRLRPAAPAAALFALVGALAGCGQDSPAELVLAARRHLTRGEVAAATIQLKNALQQQPGSAEARLLLGQTLLEQGDAVAAGVELRKALAAGSPPAAVLPPLARSLLSRREHKALTDEFGATELADAAADADLKTSLATAWAAQGRAPQADAALAAALRAGPDFAPALLLQARFASLRHEDAVARDAVERVLQRDPALAEAWAMRAALRYRVDGDVAGAIEDYRKAIALKPRLVSARAGIVALLIERQDWPGAQAQVAALRQALPTHPLGPSYEMVLAFQRRDFKATRELGQELLRLNPDNLRVLQLLGAAELEDARVLAAQTLLGRALLLAPQQAVTRQLLAQVWLRAGQPGKALAVLEPLLTEPAAPDAQTLRLAAQAQQSMGQARAAETLFQRAARLDPKDVRSRSALALGRMAPGQGDAAVSELQALAASDSGTFADLALIAALARRGEFEPALQAIDAFGHKQAGPAADQLRGQVQLARKDLPAARREFQAALAADPGYLPAAVSLAQLDLAERQPEAAQQRFERVLAADPKNMQALLALAELKGRAGASRDEVAGLIRQAVAAQPTEAAPRLRLIGFHLAQRGDSKQAALALAAAQDAVARLPNDPELLDALGRAQWATRAYSQALVSFNKLGAMLPESPMPILRIAGTYVALKDTDNAIASLRRALAIQPRLARAEQGLAALMLEAQRPEEALALARALRTQRPQEAAGAVLEGDIEAARGRVDAAIAAWRSGLKLAGSPVAATRIYGALVGAGRQAEADTFATGWTRDHPRDTMLPMFAGDTDLVRRRLPEAEARYRAVLQIDPRNTLALNNLAWVSAQLKKPEALALAERLNALAPGQPTYMDTLAMILAEANRVPQAISLQQDAVERAPGNGGLRLNLVRLYLQAGNKSAARAELDRLDALGESFPGRAEVATLRKTL